MKRARLVLLTLMFVLLPLSLLACAPAPPNEDVLCAHDLVYERPLQSLVDSTAIEGRSYFLGSGTLSSALVYRFREVLPDGATFAREVALEEAVVYEYPSDSSQVPSVSYYELSACIDRYSSSGLYRARINCMNICGEVHDVIYALGWYELSIPEGSTISIMELDLE